MATDKVKASNSAMIGMPERFTGGTSYAYYQDGGIYCNSLKPVDELSNYGVGDVVGCGYNFAKKIIIFTKNGEVLAYKGSV